MQNELTIGDKKVGRIGLGTNRIRDDVESRNALKFAASHGINFIDTASAYTGGVSEQVIGDTLAPYENIIVATKGGMVTPDFHVDSSPQMLNKQLENSLEKLKVSTIDLYFLHRVDPKVPLQTSLEFLKQMQDEEKIRHIGLSAVTVEQIEDARELVDVVAVENEFNLTERENHDVVDYCTKENIIFIPFFPLHYEVGDKAVWQRLMGKYHATEAQLALAWLLKCSPMMLPIPGSLSERHLRENVDVLNIELSDEDFASLSDAA